MGKMKCDRCKNDQNEVLILRKDKFTRRGYMDRDYHRVCFRCARKLIQNGHYNIGIYWESTIEAMGFYH